VPGGVQGLDRYAYVNNNPLNYTDPSGHCVDGVSTLACVMVAGAVIGGAISAYQQYQATGQINAEQVIDSAWKGALIGGAVVIGGMAVVGVATSIATAGVVAETTATALNADGNPTNELDTAVSIGKIPIENVTPLTKIASQINSKAGILGIPKSGNLGSLSNPVVQTSLSRLNAITSSATSQIYSGTYHKIPVFEYIDGGIGVMRNQSTGALVTVFDRGGSEIDKLYYNVNNGLGMWLR